MVDKRRASTAPPIAEDTDPTEVMDASAAMIALRSVTIPVPARRDSEPAELDVGSCVDGKYLLEAELGSGSMGTVYKARHLALDRPVAVKVLRRDYADSTAFAHRFHREARSASKLDDRHCVRILDFGEEPGGRLYMVMELVGGASLAALVERGPLPVERAVDMMTQILTALERAHEAGIVHRDLKPENVLVVRETEGGEDGKPITYERAKVCDFGIAKQMDDARSPHESGVSMHTEAGAILGTPEYMAPEQAVGENVDARADLYSAGVVLYEMLTGTRPFSGDTAMKLIISHATSAVEPPSVRLPGLDPRFDGVCLKALAKVPSERYQTAREMRRALNEVAGRTSTAIRIDLPSSEVTSVTIRALPRPEAPVATDPWRRIAMVLIAVVVLVVGALVLVLAMR